jgi:sporulation protein YlmC with PRC-barrel domain
MRQILSAATVLLLLTTGSAFAAENTAQPNQTGAGPNETSSQSAQIIRSLPKEGLPISDYYNQSVYDARDNKIGDVNDLVLDTGGKVEAVILGVGGFLGAGEKNVAVPFQALKITDKNGNRYLVMDTTKDALESAPGYTFDRDKKVWVPATKQG